MSADAVSFAYRSSPFKGATLLVHLAIADSVNDQHHNEFWMSHSRLATKARLSRQTVCAAVDELEENGFLVDLEPDKPNTGKPRRYRFCFPEVPVVYETRPVAIDDTPEPEPVGTDDRGVSAETTAPVGRSDTNPREPKEDPKQTSFAPQATHPKRATRISPDFVPRVDYVEWATREYPFVDVDSETASFVDHWLSESGKSAAKLDWNLAWRKWIRKAAAWSKPRQSEKERKRAEYEAWKRQDVEVGG